MRKQTFYFASWLTCDVLVVHTETLTVSFVEITPPLCGRCRHMETQKNAFSLTSLLSGLNQVSILNY